MRCGITRHPPDGPLRGPQVIGKSLYSHENVLQSAET